MTDAGWAEKVVDAHVCATCAEQYGMGDNGDVVHVDSVVKLLHRQHARSVRIVKRQMGVYQRQREVEKNQSKRDALAGSILACIGLLAALQRGRGGKG